MIRSIWCSVRISSRRGGAKKLITTIPVRKPDKQVYFRIHPSPDYRANVAVVMLKEDRETFLLTPSIAEAIPNEYAMVTLYVGLTRQNVLFLIPAKLPGPFRV